MNATSPIVIIALALVLGAMIGSFLNVVVARLPLGESLVTPRSRCVTCRTPIRWFDNIPLLSFLVLGGRCRQCQARIAWRYPVIEGVTALLFALAAGKFGWRPDMLLPAWVFLAALVAITAIDLEHQIIPDKITLPGTAIGVAASLVKPSLSWLDSLLGIAVGGGLILIVILASRGGMGGGDMKLCAMIGAFIGPKLALLAIFSGVVAGGVAAAILLGTGVRGRKDPIAFGPFLAGGAIVAEFCGEALIAWYFAVFLD